MVVTRKLTIAYILNRSVYMNIFSYQMSIMRKGFAGAASMRKKLCTYAHMQNHLPGGIYWDPEPSLKATLKELKPSNDLCESILGLNDYLNKSMKWLQQLLTEQQDRVLDLAIKKKREVLRERKEEDQETAKLRRENLLQAHRKKKALERRAQMERDKLSQEYLITSSEELYQTISDIDKETISISKKKAKLLKTQVNIRKKLLKQKIRITYSQQHPINEIIKELSEHIAANNLPPEYSSLISDPFSLVGKAISHKFELEETREEKWYSGVIAGYDITTKL